MHQIEITSSLNRNRLIHVLDPAATLRATMTTLFRFEGFESCFSTNTDSAVHSIERRAPDVAIINISLDDEAGLSLLRHIKSMRAAIPVIILCSTTQLEAAVFAMKLGAYDVLALPVEGERLLTVIHGALRRDVHFGAMHQGRRSVVVRGFSQLTSRERDVLQLITNGRSNKAAGIELGISPRTVEVHRARVMDKLGASNAADLLRIVLTS